jgi:antitoxin ParD1/3/4
MNVSFTEKQEKYIALQIQSGDYQNASELVRDAIRLHEVLRHKVIEDLRMEIEKGWEGPTSHRNVQSILEAKRRKRSS